MRIAVSCFPTGTYSITEIPSAPVIGTGITTVDTPWHVMSLPHAPPPLLPSEYSLPKPFLASRFVFSPSEVVPVSALVRFLWFRLTLHRTLTGRRVRKGYEQGPEGASAVQISLHRSPLLLPRLPRFPAKSVATLTLPCMSLPLARFVAVGKDRLSRPAAGWREGGRRVSLPEGEEGRRGRTHVRTLTRLWVSHYTQD